MEARVPCHNQMKNDLKFIDKKILHYNISIINKPNQEDKDNSDNSKVNMHAKENFSEIKYNLAYKLPICVTFFIDTNATVHIFGSSLNWKILLNDIQYNKAQIQWYLYSKKDSKRSSSKTKDDSNMRTKEFKEYVLASSNKEISKMKSPI